MNVPLDCLPLSVLWRYSSADANPKDTSRDDNGAASHSHFSQRSHSERRGPRKRCVSYEKGMFVDVVSKSGGEEGLTAYLRLHPQEVSLQKIVFDVSFCGFNFISLRKML